MLKKQFHETLSFIDAVFSDKFRKEFTKRTRLQLTFGEKPLMKKETFDAWVLEWERKHEL
jgi:hypothetical protein